MMRVRLSALFSLLIFCGWLPSASAQTAVTPSSTDASRAELEAQLHVADSLHRTAESFNLHRRLTDGDFEVGDRIFMVLESDVPILGISPSRDTVTVAAGRVIMMPSPIGSINLTGVLFSELTPTILGRITMYYRNVIVHTTPLLRLSITGAVGRAGFYYVPTDRPLSDLIMLSGGQASVADLDRSEIKRGQTVLWKGTDIRTALADGMTVSSLGLHAGDELVVAERKQRNWLMPALQIGTAVLTLVFTITHLK